MSQMLELRNDRVARRSPFNREDVASRTMRFVGVDRSRIHDVGQVLNGANCKTQQIFESYNDELKLHLVVVFMTPGCVKIA